ncbi:MAG TPA: hypothetical protein VI775_00015, partial [Candidatus Paceibacterota bacterium]
MDFNNLFPKDLYHSYVIESNIDDIAYLLRVFLEERGEVNRNSPDVMLSIFDSFAIQDSHDIKEWYQNKPTDGRKKICIIGAKFINREAEQSLLKIIEEPTPSSHFFIIVPDASLLLDTILSRTHLVRINGGDNNSEDDKIAFLFINSTQSTRIEKVAEIIKEFKDNENSGGLRHEATSLINGLERIIYKKWKGDVDNENLKFILNELKNCRDFLSVPGASVKMILEHIALV